MMIYRFSPFDTVIARDTIITKPKHCKSSNILTLTWPVTLSVTSRWTEVDVWYVVSIYPLSFSSNTVCIPPYLCYLPVVCTLHSIYPHTHILLIPFTYLCWWQRLYCPHFPNSSQTLVFRRSLKTCCLLCNRVVPFLCLDTAQSCWAQALYFRGPMINRAWVDAATRQLRNMLPWWRSQEMNIIKPLQASFW